MLEISVNTGFNQPNRILDLPPEGAVFSINYEIANIQDITNSGGSYTKSLSIPNSPNNREIFGFVSDMSVDLGYNYYQNISNSFNPNKKVPCTVLEDSIVIMKGYIQLTDFNINTVNNNDLLNVTIYSDNANFYIAMGDSLLTDLDFSELSFTFSKANIIGSWTESRAYYFPLIDYGKGLTLDDVQPGGLYQLSVKDFLPAVPAKLILDKIVGTIGYLYDSNFLDFDPRITNLVIPYNQQAFQTGPLFNQDKIFHVGLTPTTIGQYTTFSSGRYSGVGSPPGVINMGPISDARYGDYHNAWYDGYLLSPFQNSANRNTGFSSSTFVYDTQTIPFGNTASPMFDNVINGQQIFDTGGMYYINTSTGSVFKQRFVLKCDAVTTYSNNGNWVDNAHPIPGATPDNRKYVMCVNFFREIDPVTGTTSTDWGTGTGTLIPPDLGFQNSGTSYSIAINPYAFWICDSNGNSNCFDANGTLIVPVGDNRYLGKYCTDFTGGSAIAPGTTETALDASSQSHFKNVSGNCKTFYYNDGTHSTVKGLWTSGELPFYNAIANVPQNGDWYQQLQLQSIYLDGDPHDQFYGTTGSVWPLGNTPLFHNEKVRCVVSFGGKFAGDQTSTTDFLPPASAFLLTYTNFFNDAPYPNGNYQNPLVNNKPLTQFYNDVSLDYIEGMTINFNDIIPQNIKQREFVLDMVNRHNLYIEPSKDNPNTLIIEPREDYYNLATYSLDWRAKLDLTQPINVQVLAENQNVRTTFTDKNDNDYYNKLYTQNTNEIYGQFINQIDNDFLTGETKIESIFSPTPMAELYSYFGNSGGDSLALKGGFVLPVFVNGSNEKPTSNAGPNGAVQINYRLLYKNYISNQNRDTISLFGNATHFYPYAGPYDNPYSPTYTLNWGQTLGEFFNSATDQFFNNLVNTYWAGLLTEMTDIESRIITCYMFLTPVDINNFYFYHLVFLTIDGVDGYYKVNSIEDYVPGQNSTCKVTLLKSNSFLAPNTFSGSIGKK